jgi:hypothetical protein
MGRVGPLEVFIAMGGHSSCAGRAPGSSRGSRRSAGFSLAAAAAAAALSLAAGSGIYALVHAGRSGGESLGDRVDLHLESCRVLREAARILTGAIPAELPGPDFSFHPAGSSEALVLGLVRDELRIRRPGEASDALPARIVGRHVECAVFEPLDSRRLRVVLGFRRVVNGKAHAVQRTCIVELGPVGGE